MVPTGHHTPPKVAHSAGAFVSDDPPPNFYGACVAGDFESPERRETALEARADVREHLAACSRQGH